MPRCVQVSTGHPGPFEAPRWHKQSIKLNHKLLSRERRGTPQSLRDSLAHRCAKPIPGHFVPANRGAALIPPRCIRHRRRFGEIPLQGSQRGDEGKRIATRFALAMTEAAAAEANFSCTKSLQVLLLDKKRHTREQNE